MSSCLSAAISGSYNHCHFHLLLVAINNGPKEHKAACVDAIDPLYAALAKNPTSRTGMKVININNNQKVRCRKVLRCPSAQQPAVELNKACQTKVFTPAAQ